MKVIVNGFPFINSTSILDIPDRLSEAEKMDYINKNEWQIIRRDGENLVLERKGTK